MNRRILVIDDNRAIHEDFRKVLIGEEKKNLVKIAEALLGETRPFPIHPVFSVDYALQGEEAIEIFRNAHAAGAPYAVAFVDVRMPPGIDGIETATRLWQINPTLQIVICSAYADYTWEKIALRLNHRDRLLVLKKPFAGIEVLQLACALTEKWDLEQQASHRLENIEREVATRTNALVIVNQQLAEEIEQRKTAEEQLLRSQRIESIGFLASGIAHDLNNLLSPIMMCAQLLEDETLRADQQALLATIQTSTDRAAKILAQMLTFARGTSDDRTKFEPAFLLQEIARIVGKTFSSLSIEVRCKASVDLPAITGNQTQLHQVLMNLCINARDAMPGGGTLQLDAESITLDESYAGWNVDARKGEYVLLRVTDTGTGIPDEIRTKIFDPFFSTKEPGKGTGLGLSTAAGIVRNHSGFMEIQSTPGRGTCFLIYLPATVGNEMQTATEFLAPPRGNGELILIVDDESAVLEATAAMLNRHGYRAITAENSVDAILAYTRELGKIRVVVTDVNMPILDGAAFINVLRKITSDVRIILTTGSIDTERVRQFSSMSVCGVLSKPYHSRQLLNLLHETLSSCQNLQVA